MAEPGTDPRPPTVPHDPAGFGRGRWRHGWLIASVWLVYLTDVLASTAANPNRAYAVAGLLSVLAFAALYVTVFAGLRRRRRQGRAVPLGARVGAVGLGLVLFGVAAATGGESALAMLVFLAVIVMLALPFRLAAATVVLLVAIVEVASRVVSGWQPQDQLGFQVVLTAFAIWGVLQLIQRNDELAAAQRQIADLAVSAERNRFARDLHDLLGHSLTVITLKTELAGRLVRLDPGRAEAEIAEVERLAREALTDVRSAVSGYREANLAQELAAARAALDAAGIEAQLPTAVDDVPGERRELFGWVVREGVTNVIRHSGARTCRIVLGRNEVRVEDDGAGPGPVAASGSGGQPAAGADGSGDGVTGRAVTGQGRAAGHGVAGLRERAEAAGAQLMIGRSELGGLLLRVAW